MRLPVAAKIALADSRGDRRHAGLAESAGRLTRLEDVHLGDRDLGDPHHRVGVEVRLLDAPGVERDLAVERRRRRVDRAALHLRLDLVRVDRDPAVDRTDDPVDADGAIVGDGHLGDMGRVARVGEADRDATRLSGRERRAPAGLGRGELQHRLVAGRLPEQGAAVLVGILASLVRQLVD
jgi:hypothetical protein